MNHKIKDIHSREELEDFIQKAVGKEAIPELVDKILSHPSAQVSFSFAVSTTQI